MCKCNGSHSRYISFILLTSWCHVSRLKTVAVSARCRITNDAFPHILVTWLKSSCNYCRSLSRFTSASIIVWIFLRFFFRTRAWYFVITNAPIHNSQSFVRIPRALTAFTSGADQITWPSMTWRLLWLRRLGSVTVTLKRTARRRVARHDPTTRSWRRRDSPS